MKEFAAKFITTRQIELCHVLMSTITHTTRIAIKILKCIFVPVRSHLDGRNLIGNFTRNHFFEFQFSPIEVALVDWMK